jgi:hypothetical protein
VACDTLHCNIASVKTCLHKLPPLCTHMRLSSTVHAPSQLTQRISTFLPLKLKREDERVASYGQSACACLEKSNGTRTRVAYERAKAKNALMHTHASADPSEPPPTTTAPADRGRSTVEAAAEACRTTLSAGRGRARRAPRPHILPLHSSSKQVVKINHHAPRGVRAQAVQKGG